MSAQTWLRLNQVLLVFFVALTIFCLTPGPGQDLASSTKYVSLVSNVALILASAATIAGARAERANES